MTTSAPVLLEVPLEDVETSYQAIRDVERERVTALRGSIERVGLLQPIVVRRRAEGGFQLVAGAHRLEAVRSLRWKRIAAHVLEADDGKALEAAIAENRVRSNLSTFEAAAAAGRLLDSGRDLAEAAAALSTTRGRVRRLAEIAKLAQPWRTLAESERGAWLTEAHLEVVALLDEAAREDLLDELGEWRETCTVEELRRLLRERSREITAAPWPHDDATLLPKAGACSACPKRSDHEPSLFDGIDLEGEDRKPARGARCLDRMCWTAKGKAWLEGAIATARAEHGSELVLVHGEPRGPEGSEFWHALGAPGRAVGAYEWKRAKGRKGGVPALIVSGKGIGSVLRIEPPARSRGPGRQRGKAGAAKPERGSEEDLLQRREKLEARRAAWIVAAVRERLDEWEPDGDAPLPEDGILIALAATFGTAPPWQIGEPPITNPAELPGAAARARLLKLVVEAARTRLLAGRNLSSLVELEREARFAARHLLGDTHQALDEAAEEAIPIPAVHARLEEAAEAGSSSPAAPAPASSSKPSRKAQERAGRKTTKGREKRAERKRARTARRRGR